MEFFLILYAVFCVLTYASILSSDARKQIPDHQVLFAVVAVPITLLWPAIVLTGLVRGLLK